MIAWLQGRVLAVEEDSLILNVGGVGYRLHCPARVLAALAVGEAAELRVETHMREGAIQLFGFRDEAEQRWFRLLQNIQGVGTRLALSLLATFTPEQLGQAVSSGDRAMLTRANGVGPRLAGRIIAELEPRIGALPIAGGAAETPLGSRESEDALSALLNLGYARAEAYRAVAQARRRLGESASVDALVREALRELAP